MTGADVRAGRERRGLNQSALARQLGVSQGYVSLLESGQRPVAHDLAARLVLLLSLSPSALPVSEPRPLPHGKAAGALGRLGYPGFAYLRNRTPANPSAVLLGVLLADDVDARVVEGLPWLLLQYPDVDWAWLVPRVKQHDGQNRLGFLVALARSLADATGDVAGVERLRQRESELRRSVLLHDDAFSRSTLTNAERTWLSVNRSPEAKHWNVLSTLTVDRLLHAA